MLEKMSGGFNAAVSQIRKNEGSLWPAFDRAIITNFGYGPASEYMKSPIMKFESLRVALGGKIPMDADSGEIRMSDDFARSMVTDAISTYLPANKEAHDKNGDNPYEHAAIAFAIKNKDNIALRQEVDPKTGKKFTLLELNGFEQTVIDANRLTGWTGAQVMTSLEAMYSATQPDIYNQLVRGSVKVHGMRADDGTMLYKASGAYPGGGTKILGFVDPKDPSWNTEANKLAAAVTSDLAKIEGASNWNPLNWFAKVWELKFQRPELVQAIQDKYLAAADRTKGPSQAWTDMVIALRGVATSISGNDDPALWDPAQRQQVGETIRARGSVWTIFQGPYQKHYLTGGRVRDLPWYPFRPDVNQPPPDYPYTDASGVSYPAQTQRGAAAGARSAMEQRDEAARAAALAAGQGNTAVIGPRTDPQPPPPPEPPPNPAVVRRGPVRVRRGQSPDG
jgi:hypothetical protein